MTVDVNKIPEPFREFLTNEGVSEAKEIYAASINEPEAKSKSENMQDLLFLAAILMLTDE